MWRTTELKTHRLKTFTSQTIPFVASLDKTLSSICRSSAVSLSLSSSHGVRSEKKKEKESILLLTEKNSVRTADSLYEVSRLHYCYIRRTFFNSF